MSTALAVVAAPDAERIKAETLPILHRAQALVNIDNPDTYETALVLIRDMRQGEKRVTELFEPARKSLDSAKKELLKLRDGVVEPIAEARVSLGHRCEPWEAEQKRLAEVERQRQIAEATKAEEDRRAQEAILAEEAGAVEEAEEIESAPLVVPFVPPVQAVPKVAGISARENWRCEVVDFEALVRYVAEDAAARKWLLQPHESNLNGEARMAKASFSIPGCKAVVETVRSVRG